MVLITNKQLKPSVISEQFYFYFDTFILKVNRVINDLLWSLHHNGIISCWSNVLECTPNFYSMNIVLTMEFIIINSTLKTKIERHLCVQGHILSQGCKPSENKQ